LSRQLDSGHKSRPEQGETANHFSRSLDHDRDKVKQLKRDGYAASIDPSIFIWLMLGQMLGQRVLARAQHGNLVIPSVRGTCKRGW
jgi:hypothetical protein